MWFGLQYFRSDTLQQERLAAAWYGRWQLWETFNWCTWKGMALLPDFSVTCPWEWHQKNTNFPLKSCDECLLQYSDASSVSATPVPGGMEAPTRVPPRRALHRSMQLWWLSKNRLGPTCWFFAKKCFFRAVTFQSSDFSERADDYTKILVYLHYWFGSFICRKHLTTTKNNPDEICKSSRREMYKKVTSLRTQKCSSTFLFCMNAGLSYQKISYPS